MARPILRISVLAIQPALAALICTGIAAAQLEPYLEGRIGVFFDPAGQSVSVDVQRFNVVDAYVVAAPREGDSLGRVWFSFSTPSPLVTLERELLVPAQDLAPGADDWDLDLSGLCPIGFTALIRYRAVLLADALHLKLCVEPLQDTPVGYVSCGSGTATPLALVADRCGLVNFPYACGWAIRPKAMTTLPMGAGSVGQMIELPVPLNVSASLIWTCYEGSKPEPPPACVTGLPSGDNLHVGKSTSEFPLGMVLEWDPDVATLEAVLPTQAVQGWSLESLIARGRARIELISPAYDEGFEASHAFTLRFRTGSVPGSTLLHASSSSFGTLGLPDRYFVTDGRLDVVAPGAATAPVALNGTGASAPATGQAASFGTLKALYREQ